MPKAINNADAAQALTRAYALKGRVNLQLDEMVVPVAIVDNLGAEGSPIELRPCAGESNQVGVAGETAFVGVQTQANLILSISEVWVLNLNPAGVSVELVTFSAANLAAIGISLGSLIALDLPEDSNTVSSQFWFGTQVAAVGALIGRFHIPGAVSTRIPVGGTIHGIDNPNRVAFGIRGTGLAQPVRATFFCVERDGA